MNSYELSRKWFNWSFDNPEKIRPIHGVIYFFAIEHCNRLGWKDKFGFPSQMVMEAIGVKNWRTYSKALNDLVDFGFIKMIETSKNQYSSNIIAIVKSTKANTNPNTKALDKALSKHHSNHSQSTVSINKQTNNETIKQTNNISFEKEKKQKFSFLKSLLDLGVDENIARDYLAVRKNKKATNSKTAFDKIATEIEKCPITAKEAIKLCAENSWSGFKYSWVINLNNASNKTSDGTSTKMRGSILESTKLDR